jgi:two-component system, OmpR family, response regulator ChvI
MHERRSAFPVSPSAPVAQRVAVIEDDPPTSDQLKGWILAARPALVVDQWFTRDEAEAALARQRYDAVVLDIELGRERHAGVALINAINKRHAGTPVLVVSAMPAAVYRSIMKALDAWDYLQKTTFEETEFIETLLEILRTSERNERNERNERTGPGEALAAGAELVLDPLRQAQALYQGQRVNLPLTAQRILAVLHARRGDVVSYDELYAVIKSGRNRDNVRKHVSTIREALREIEPDFDAIENVPMRGFRWRA